VLVDFISRHFPAMAVCDEWLLLHADNSINSRQLRVKGERNMRVFTIMTALPAEIVALRSLFSEDEGRLRALLLAHNT